MPTRGGSTTSSGDCRDGIGEEHAGRARRAARAPPEVSLAQAQSIAVVAAHAGLAAQDVAARRMRICWQGAGRRAAPADGAECRHRLGCSLPRQTGGGLGVSRPARSAPLPAWGGAGMLCGSRATGFDYGGCKVKLMKFDVRNRLPDAPRNPAWDQAPVLGFSDGGDSFAVAFSVLLLGQNIKSAHSGRVWLFCSEVRVRLQDRVLGSGRGGCGVVPAAGAIASTRRSRRWR